MYRTRFRSTGPLISAIDICCGRTPEFLSDSRHYLRNHPLSSPFRNPQFEGFLWGDLFSVAYELHGLTYMLDLHMERPSAIRPIHREFFEDTWAAVQHSLADFPYPHAVGIIKSVMYLRQHCWRMATLLYCNMALRSWDRSSGMIKSMVEQLISALRESDLSSIWNPFPDVLVWVLSMGSFAADATAESDWLVLELRSVVKILGLQRFEDLEALLKSLLYRDSTFQAPLRTLWKEIAS